MKENLKRLVKEKGRFLVLFLVVLSLKALLIPLTSHPFDFASYVFQIRQIYDLGTDPFFYWNKGIFLWLFFLSSYHVFDLLIKLPLIQTVPVELYHISFKLPFLLLDIASAFLVSKLVFLLTKDEQKAILGFFLWFANPMVWWTTYIHGQYSVLVSFLLLGWLYWMIQKRYLFSTVSLALATSVYYFPIIFLPILFLRKIYESVGFLTYFKQCVYIFSGFVVVLLLIFSPFLINQDRFSWIVSSVVHHAQPDAPRDVKEVMVPNYSLLSFPSFLLQGEKPSNLTSPKLYFWSTKSTILSVVLVCAFFAYLGFLAIKHGRKNDDLDRWTLESALIAMSLFMVFFGKFQAHYILWILPLLTVYIVSYSRRAFLLPYFVISFAPLVLAVSTQDLGVFFLDSLNWGSLKFVTGFSPLLISFLAFLTVISLLGVGLALLLNPKHTIFCPRSIYLKAILQNTFPFFVLFFTVSMLFFSAFVLTQAYTFRWYQSPKQFLASENRVMTYSYVTTLAKNISVRDQTKVIMDVSSFVGQDTTTSISGYIPTNEETKNIYFYNFYNTKDLSFNTKNGTLNTFLVGTGVKAEISLGSSDSPYLLPLSQRTLYEVEYEFSYKGNKSAYLTPSVRYGDENGKIIAPHTNKFVSFTKENRDVYVGEVYSSNLSYKFFEPLITLESPKGTRWTDDEIALHRIKVTQPDRLNTLFYRLTPPEGFESVTRNILKNEKASTLYYVSIRINFSNKSQSVSNMKLNGCQPIDSLMQLGYEVFNFNLGCLDLESKDGNSLQFDFKNLGSRSVEIDSSIVHDSIPRIPIEYNLWK